MCVYIYLYDILGISVSEIENGNKQERSLSQLGIGLPVSITDPICFP
jgi:hypothetical protein